MIAAGEPLSCAGLHETRRGVELPKWIPSEEHSKRGRTAIETGGNILVNGASPGLTKPSKRIEQPLPQPLGGCFGARVAYCAIVDGDDQPSRSVAEELGRIHGIWPIQALLGTLTPAS